MIRMLTLKRGKLGCRRVERGRTSGTIGGKLGDEDAQIINI